MSGSVSDAGRGSAARTWPPATRCSMAQGVVLHAERRLALEAGVERRAEREDVAGLAHLRALSHLGGQEGRRPGDLPGLGQRDVAAGVRDAEVGDLDQALDVRPPWPIRMLAGFTSRCTMPAACVAARASATWAPICATWSGAQRRRPRSAPARGCGRAGTP